MISLQEAGSIPCASSRDQGSQGGRLRMGRSIPAPGTSQTPPLALWRLHAVADRVLPAGFVEGDEKKLAELPIPGKYRWVPPRRLPSVFPHRFRIRAANSAVHLGKDDLGDLAERRRPEIRAKLKMYPGPPARAGSRKPRTRRPGEKRICVEPLSHSVPAAA
jgi:hypothetical protein